MIKIISVLRTIPCNTRLQAKALFYTSGNVQKIHKTDKKKPSQVLYTAAGNTQPYPHVQAGLKEMDTIFEDFNDKLNKHISLQVDLRVYEDIKVKLENGSEQKLGLLGRVSLQSAQKVMINFTDNPTAIKPSKIALQAKSFTVQQEGVFLYINVQRMTRERRENIASIARGKMLNEYKSELNNIYSVLDKKCQTEVAKLDDQRGTRSKLLEVKKAMEKKGEEFAELKIKELLKELV